MRRQTLTRQTALQTVALQEIGAKPGRERLLNLSIFIVLLAALITCSPAGAYAQASEEDPTVTSFEQHDLDGDTTPDQAIILVEHMGHRHRVVVYDHGQDMKWSDDWQQGTDFANDVWLFQNEVGDQTKLIIRFSHDHTGYTAELFDDTTGNGVVSYTVDATGQVRITESELPIARFTAEQPWILADGKANYMVTITAYGRLHNMISGIGWDVSMLPDDGRLAWSQEVVDLDSDSVPDYELIQVFPDIPADWGVYRTNLRLHLSKKLPAGFRSSLLWPYLGYAESEGWRPVYLERNPGNHYYTPPVQFDWKSGRILGVGNFLPGYGTGDRYGFLSMTPLTKGEINELHFDRSAHYYFTGSSMPDMFFRLIRDGLGDSVQVGSKTLYAQQVGFNWHHRDLGAMQWDYKLELTGLYELPSTLMRFKDFSLRDVPFGDLLWWFTTRECAYATFVVAEEHAYPSNEGIWEWMTLWGVVNDVSDGLVTIPGSRDAQRGYILGESDTSPAQYYTEIREGFRGEYGELNGLAQLYFSPIDHKLHLFKAQKGVWNLDARREIRYANLAGSYINQWTLLEGEKTLKNLYDVAGYLVYGGEGNIRLRKNDKNPSIFTTLPPRNHEEWLKLGADLDRFQANFAPDDFEAMVDQFEGPGLSITGASLRDFRLDGDGFRFVLELQPGFSLEGPDLVGLQGLAPGEYVVMCDGREFKVLPLTPAAIIVDGLRLDGQSESPLYVSQWTTIESSIQNAGLEDLYEPGLCLYFSGPLGERQVITSTVVLLPGESTQTLRWHWAPPTPGTWLVSLETGCETTDEGIQKSSKALASTSVNVLPPERPPSHWLLTLGGLLPVASIWFLVIFFTAITLLAGGLILVWTRSGQSSNHSK